MRTQTRETCPSECDVYIAASRASQGETKHVQGIHLVVIHPAVRAGCGTSGRTVEARYDDTGGAWGFEVEHLVNPLIPRTRMDA